MGKLIFFLIIIGMIYMLFKKKSVPASSQKESNSDDLIQCDKCKTFYPQNEIKNINGKNICKDCYANS